MWPPLELATRIFDISSIAFFASLVVGLIATGLIIWMGYVKEHHWAALRGEAQVKIAGLESETAKAHAEIDKSRAAISMADARAADANKKAAIAITDAARANERAGHLSVEAERLRQQNLETESRLERERTARRELEIAIAPRLLEQRAAAEELKRFPTMQANVETVRDSEARRTAGQIVAMLEMAQWHVGGPIVVPDDRAIRFFPGIAVLSSVGALALDDLSGRAADAIVRLLTSDGVEARKQPTTLPPNTVVIRVGLKPIGHFVTKKLDEIASTRRVMGNMTDKPPLPIPSPE